MHLNDEGNEVLHLLRFSRHQGQRDVPFAVAQSGIAKAIKIHRNNIPRTMNKLIERDFVHKKPFMLEVSSSEGLCTF